MAKSTKHRPLKIGTVLEGRYGVVRALSGNDLHYIYEGRQTNLGLPVLLKTLKQVYPDPIQAQQQVDQMVLEAKILASLNHPNLVTVYDCFFHEGMPYLVTEYVEGFRLSEVAEKAPKNLSAKRVLIWAEQLLDVLSYLHSQDPQVIVRDLKPSNTILAKDGRLRLVDFGLAKRMGAAGSGTQEIVKGVGADGYAPLEQTAYSKTSPATDLYSLGATLYFLLTKVHPPSAAERVIAAKDPLVDARTLNDTVGDHVWHAVEKLMAIRLQERPQSAAEARESLFPSVSAAPEAESVALRRCLGCGEGLEVVDRQGIEIDQCPSCSGIWLDCNELESLLELGLNGNNVTYVDDLEIPVTNKVWQFLREVLGRSK